MERDYTKPSINLKIKMPILYVCRYMNSKYSTIRAVKNEIELDGYIYGAFIYS